MRNENIVILGDSYSTFEGFIPEGYAFWYPKAEGNKVTAVEQTWWYKLAKETESCILLNDSWSGSTLCNVGWHGDCSTTSSFIHRATTLADSGFFAQNKVDRVFVFGGTNDSWIGTPCGNAQYANWSKEDMNKVLPGFCCTMDQLTRAVPKEKIHVVINTELREEISQGLITVSAHYGVGYICLEDIEKYDGHPTCVGMEQIKQQILSQISQHEENS